MEVGNKHYDIGFCISLILCQSEKGCKKKVVNMECQVQLRM